MEHLILQIRKWSTSRVSWLPQNHVAIQRLAIDLGTLRRGPYPLGCTASVFSLGIQNLGWGLFCKKKRTVI